MARLAEIKNVIAGATKQPVLTIYVNPANVASVEPIGRGTKIVFTNGESQQTNLPIADVVKAIQEAML